jgi:hypothetical protein
MDVPKYPINFSPGKSIPTNFYPACPIGPEDRIGVKFTAGEEQSEFNRGDLSCEIHAKHEGRSPFHWDKPEKPKKPNPSVYLNLLPFSFNLSPQTL